MELCDVYNADGTRRGEIVPRGTILPENCYFLAVQVWLRNRYGDYLIQQRALHLMDGPGLWVTTAGYVVAGESSKAGAIREVREAIGIEIDPTSLHLWQRLKTQTRIEDVWIAEFPDDAMGSPTLDATLNDWMWTSKQGLGYMIQNGAFFAYRYFEMLPD